VRPFTKQVGRNCVICPYRVRGQGRNVCDRQIRFEEAVMCVEQGTIPQNEQELDLLRLNRSRRLQSHQSLPVSSIPQLLVAVCHALGNGDSLCSL